MLDNDEEGKLGVAVEAMGVDEGVAMRGERGSLLRLDLEHPAAARAVAETVSAAALGALPRLAVGAVQAVGGLALDDAHGFGAIAERRALDVVHAGSTGEVALVHLVRALRPRGLTAALPAARRVLARGAPRVEALGSLSPVDAAPGVGVLRLGHRRHVQRQASTPDARGSRAGTRGRGGRDERGSRKHVESLDARGVRHRVVEGGAATNGRRVHLAREDQFVTWRWGGVLFPN